MIGQHWISSDFIQDNTTSCDIIQNHSAAPKHHPRLEVLRASESSPSSSAFLTLMHGACILYFSYRYVSYQSKTFIINEEKVSLMSLTLYILC